MLLNKTVLIACNILLAGSSIFAQDTSQQIVPGRFNGKSQEQKPYVILISADGFRWDFADKYHAVTLLTLREAGVSASSMIPCYPSLTFPNHYSIITGMYPAHHGLVENNFYDRNRKESYSDGDKKKVADGSWYGGTPLWVLAEQQQMLSASFYWVAAEADIKAMHQTYYYQYNDKIDIDNRIQIVKNWLQLPENRRPHFISFYLPQVDHEAHNHGPESEQTKEAVQFVDDAVRKLTTMVDSLHLPVNFIFVSDHGMTSVDSEHPLALPETLRGDKFIIPNSNALLQVYARDKKDIAPAYLVLKQQGDRTHEFDVYLRENIPARWHYTKKDDRYNRIGDLLLVPRLPHVFSPDGKAITPGKHGFDPAIKDMQSVFYAWGPAFKSRYKIGSFENVHIYPLIAKILGLKYTQDIDGRLSVLLPVLK